MSNYPFSLAIKNNIKKTYTYAYAKNTGKYGGHADWYDPVEFFHEQLSKEPFETLMELDRFAYRRTLNTLIKYGIPYTKEQEYRARVFYEVTERMAKERRDAVNIYVEGDLKKAGLVKLNDGYLITTQNTLQVANFIDKLPKNKKTDNVVYESKINQLSKEQRAALTGSLGHQISCLIGRAGTGKSYVTAEIVDQLRLNKKKTAVLAPTHKAKEALQSKLKTGGGEVRTIHSFVHQKETKGYDAIVIDEAGMLSTPLFNKLIRVYSGQQLIFIGDKNQLPPIEYGRPFERLQEEFMTSELKKNHRSDSKDIINLGNQLLGIPHNANMPIENIEILGTFDQARKKGAEVILTFTNDNVKAVNEEWRLKTGANSMYPGFKIGERIIAKTNYGNKFYNGQLFEVVGYNRIKDINTGRHVTLNSAREFEYNFNYAYALTIHKSQGSEWDKVGYLPSEYDTANLAYVAVTRAKDKLYIVDRLNEHYPKERKWRHLHEDYSI